MKIFTLFISLLSFGAAIWIIIPAPAYNIWLFSVAVSEWSLWLAAFALIAIILSLYIPFSNGSGKLWIVTLIISTSTLIISLYPLFSVLSLAQKFNASLSFSEYFGGAFSEKPSVNDYSTRVFASIDDQELKFDVYPPTVKNENNGAAIVVVHGGSWNAGERNDFPQWNQWLAANGYKIFDIDYRLVPQPNYLTATGDVKCAVLQIKEHAAEFNISPDRIALFGRSAGAHLALLAAYSADNAKLPPSCAADDQSEKVRAVVSFYAPIDLIWGYDNPANQRVIDGPQKLADFLGGNPHSSDEIRDRYILAAPLTHVSEKTPPTLFIHGGQDQIVREENMQFADEKLNTANIPHETILIPYAQHGFDYNFHGFGSQITRHAMLEFLRENTK